MLQSKGGFAKLVRFGIDTDYTYTCHKLVMVQDKSARDISLHDWECDRYLHTTSFDGRRPNLRARLLRNIHMGNLDCRSKRATLFFSQKGSGTLANKSSTIILPCQEFVRCHSCLHGEHVPGLLPSEIYAGIRLRWFSPPRSNET